MSAKEPRRWIRLPFRRHRNEQAAPADPHGETDLRHASTVTTASAPSFHSRDESPHALRRCPGRTDSLTESERFERLEGFNRWMMNRSEDVVMTAEQEARWFAGLPYGWQWLLEPLTAPRNNNDKYAKAWEPVLVPTVCGSHMWVQPDTGLVKWREIDWNGDRTSADATEAGTGADIKLDGCETVPTTSGHRTDEHHGKASSITVARYGGLDLLTDLGPAHSKSAPAPMRERALFKRSSTAKSIASSIRSWVIPKTQEHTCPTRSSERQQREPKEREQFSIREFFRKLRHRLLAFRTGVKKQETLVALNAHARRDSLGPKNERKEDL